MVDAVASRTAALVADASSDIFSGPIVVQRINRHYEIEATIRKRDGPVLPYLKLKRKRALYSNFPRDLDYLRIDLNAIKLEYHRCSRDCATFAADRAIRFNSTQRIVRPFLIALMERRYCQLETMKKITSTAR